MIFSSEKKNQSKLAKKEENLNFKTTNKSNLI